MNFRTSCLWLSGFLFVFVVLFNGPAGGEEKYALDKSIAEALKNNWTVKAKKERIEESRFAKKRAFTGFLPRFSTSYGYTYLDEEPTANFGMGPPIQMGTRDNFQWKTSVTQPLFTGFALLSQYELAKLGIDQSKLELELEKLDLILRVKDAYFRVLGADRGVEVAQKAVEALESHVEVAKSFYKVGMIPINDLLKAEVQLGNAQSDLIRAQNAAQLSRATFNVALARPVSTPVDLVDVSEFQPDTGQFEDYLKQALKIRPEIQVIEVSIMQTDQQKRLVNSDMYPEVSFVYDYIKEGDSASVSGSDYHEANEWQAMAVLRWTFWEWGKTRYSAREKESLRIQLTHTREALIDQIGLEIEQAMLDLREAEKNIPVAKKAVEQGEENLRVSSERYKAQVTTSTEVLDAQTLLTEARVNYFQALYSHHLAKARLVRAIGENAYEQEE